MTSFPTEKYAALLRAIEDKEYSGPNECFEFIAGIDRMFQKALDEDFSCSPLPYASKNRLRDLAGLCSPILDYDIEESYKLLLRRLAAGRTDYIAPVYSLRIRTTAAEIVRQEEALQAAALGCFANPMLKSGVTPHYILTELVDKSSQEIGVDDPEEIAKIVGRLLSRFFTDREEAETEAAAAAFEADPAEAGGRFATFAEVMRVVKSQRKIVAARLAAHYCASNPVIATIAEWISPAPASIGVAAMPIGLPAMNDAERIAVIHYPEMQYTIDSVTGPLERNLRKLIGLFKDADSKMLIRTSLTSLKHGLRAIPSLPPQDLSLSLRRLVEDNFNVTLIEVDSEDDRYATPEYFEASRSNVAKVVTTRPAVIGPDGKIIVKGIYVVPMK